MAQHGTTTAEELRRVLADLDDVRAWLVKGGLAEQDVTKLQRRLLDP
jgi:hypothetical protein